MSPTRDLTEQLIWATRGRSWGFRFLLDAGLPDPLPEYERVFAGLKDEPVAWQRIRGKVALRFPDPQGRRDASGRIIPHEFVIFGDLADPIESGADGLQRVWPLVSEAYARVWDAEQPPSHADLQLTTKEDSPFDLPNPPGGEPGE